MTPTQQKALAKRIAKKLFTACDGERADHLQQWKDGVYLGGWCERAVANVIETELAAAEKR